MSCVLTKQHKELYFDDEVSKQHVAPYTECPRSHRKSPYLPCGSTCVHAVCSVILQNSKVICGEAVGICMYAPITYTEQGAYVQIEEYVR